jgi:hypothetical protein
MRFARPGIPEGSLAAHFEYLCSLSGAQRMAYVPVVASGSVYPFPITRSQYGVTHLSQTERSHYSLHV